MWTNDTLSHPSGLTIEIHGPRLIISLDGRVMIMPFIPREADEWPKKQVDKARAEAVMSKLVGYNAPKQWMLTSLYAWERRHPCDIYVRVEECSEGNGKTWQAKCQEWISPPTERLASAFQDGDTMYAIVEKYHQPMDGEMDALFERAI